ncbi:peptidase inhibitor family I36 protein [Nocardia crassostreae]|uniref:peptidase inhibitor family I36 protein n=1 Tax=Nocardia crassostreae TaxID=53428 RepID=UPI00082FFC36|nr:peptidase inhibitor family I36 protein [Nocardia crassostreae]
MISRSSSRLAALAAAAVLTGAAGVAVFSPVTASAQGYDCPGGLFCGYDGADGDNMFVQINANCLLHDIGNAGKGDRLTSYWNRTGATVGIYNWTGGRWDLLASVPDNGRGNLSYTVDDTADAVKVCD